MSRRCMALIAGLFFFALPIVAPAAENVWSTESFMGRKADWDQLLGATIRIEGRVSLSGGGQIRLAKCEVSIHASDAAIRAIHGKKAVEITGRLIKENGKLILEADRVQVIQTDLEQFESRSAKLRNTKAVEWYALGDWATERSRFYEDADLSKKAAAAYERGITIEWRGMEADDANARFQLAEKASQYKISDPRRMELIHEGDRILRTQAAKASDRELWAKLLARLPKDFPGCTQPLASVPAELNDRYERDPLVVYHDSSAEVRQQLHRLFYISVLVKSILDEATKDGSNADVIAKRLEQEVPEASALAAQYRQLKLKWRLEQAATATRPEIEQLAADFKAVQQPEQARQALTRWLQARESGLRQDGPAGLLQLADEYQSLLQDEPKAVTLLADANRLDPSVIEVTDKLRSLGYTNLGGTWVKSKGDTPPTPLAMDINPGTVAVGMAGTAVRAAMGADPSSLSRVLTKRGSSEVWSYGVPGSRLIIRLEGNKTNDLKVMDIKNER